MIELRVGAVVGLLVVMIGSAVTVIAAWAVAERLRPIWERMRRPGLQNRHPFDAGVGGGDSPRRRGTRAILTAIRTRGGEIR